MEDGEITEDEFLEAEGEPMGAERDLGNEGEVGGDGGQELKRCSSSRGDLGRGGFCHYWTMPGNDWDGIFRY